MPEIEISEDQRAYLEDLRAELAAEHVGEYGVVRPLDALQFLIDHREGDVEESTGTETESDAQGEDNAQDENDTEDEDDEGEPEASEQDDADGDEADGPGRLQAMMRLLEDHEDKWEEVDAEQGKYAVELPDGGTEHARTKDDVRGLLFKHYR